MECPGLHSSTGPIDLAWYWAERTFSAINYWFKETEKKNSCHEVLEEQYQKKNTLGQLCFVVRVQEL